MKIVRCGAYESFYDMPLAIDWMLTKRCNYRCSYCFHYGYGQNPPPQLPFSTLDQLKAAVDNIASLNRPWYDVILTGGEPTIHPHVGDLMYLLQSTLKDRLNEILLISNCSRNEGLYDAVADLSKRINISMQLSIHTDHVDMEHILKLIEKLSGKVNFFFNLMFNPAKRDMVHEIYDILYEYRKHFLFGLIIATIRKGDAIDPRYMPEDFIWQEQAQKDFSKLYNDINFHVQYPRKKQHRMRMFHEIIDNGELKVVETREDGFAENLKKGLCDFSGMYCIANTANLRIEENGLCRGMICGLVPNICNIYQEGSLKAVRDKLIHAVQCTRKCCGCPTSNFIPKFAFPLEAMRFMEVAHARQEALFESKK